MDCHTEILITDLIPTVIPENKKTSQTWKTGRGTGLSQIIHISLDQHLLYSMRSMAYNSLELSVDKIKSVVFGNKM